jgi:hypothetical protein
MEAPDIEALTSHLPARRLLPRLWKSPALGGKLSGAGDTRSDRGNRNGYVGLVVGACLVETGNDVVCADVDVRKIEALRENRFPSTTTQLAMPK